MKIDIPDEMTPGERKNELFYQLITYALKVNNNDLMAAAAWTGFSANYIKGIAGRLECYQKRVYTKRKHQREKDLRSQAEIMLDKGIYVHETAWYACLPHSEREFLDSYLSNPTTFKKK